MMASLLILYHIPYLLILAISISMQIDTDMCIILRLEIKRQTFTYPLHCTTNYVVYKIPYRRARAWPSARASKGILHTTNYVQ